MGLLKRGLAAPVNVAEEKQDAQVRAPEPDAPKTPEQRLAEALKEVAFREGRLRDLIAEQKALKTKIEDMRAFYESAKANQVADGLPAPALPDELRKAEIRLRDELGPALPVAQMKRDHAKGVAEDIRREIFDAEQAAVLVSRRTMIDLIRERIKEAVNLYAVLDHTEAHEIARHLPADLNLPLIPRGSMEATDDLRAHLPAACEAKGRRSVAFDGLAALGMKDASIEELKRRFSEWPVL